jgi:SNF2 family DNA or RNA helicase
MSPLFQWRLPMDWFSLCSLNTTFCQQYTSNMSISGKKILSELSVEQAGKTRENLLPGNPDIVAKPTLQVKTGAPDDMAQLTDAAANMTIATPAEDEEAAKKRRIVQKKELDTIFADSMLKDHVPDMKMPAALKVELFPYQQDGVRWLAFQENNVDSVPPFWKERQMGSKTKWWCPITNVYQDDKPAPIRGSILADGKCIV